MHIYVYIKYVGMYVCTHVRPSTNVIYNHLFVVAIAVVYCQKH